MEGPLQFHQFVAYAGFMTGAAVMICLHNMFLSFILYKTRQTNVSNLIKIIFNFCNILRYGTLWGFFMTPQIAPLVQCIALQYINVIGGEVARISLTAFLLWRVKQVHNGKIDSWIGMILLTIRVALSIPVLFFQRPATIYDAEQNLVVCDTSSFGKEIVLAAIMVEIVADIFVTFRLVQILRKANINAASISSNMARKSKRTLFTAVMYWNFLRLFVALVFHVIPLINSGSNEVIFFSVFPIITIILSYVITVDAEIVRVIEGKNTKKGSSAGTEKSFSASQSSRTPHTQSLPKYSQSTSDTYSQIDKDKIAIVSMKRLSFFEWANFVVGKRLRRDDEEQYEDENTEEIIDEPSGADNDDIEKGFPQDRRSSTFSGTTSVSTLDENPDIVIETKHS